MEDLIRALQILLKYGNSKYPTHCEHDELSICDIDPSKVSEIDIVELDRLGFIISEENECFISYKFGSC